MSIAVRRIKTKPRANLTVRLSHSERRLVAGWARVNGASKSDIIRELIDREHRRLDELAVQAMNVAAGLVASDPDLVAESAGVS